jgi:hypothetical protein
MKTEFSPAGDKGEHLRNSGITKAPKNDGGCPKPLDGGYSRGHHRVKAKVLGA